jgi:hypothetical protein
MYALVSVNEAAQFSVLFEDSFTYGLGITDDIDI